MVVILNNRSRILKVVKYLPRQVLIRQSAPLDSEFLHILAMLAILGFIQQCVNICIVVDIHGGGLAFGDNTYIQNTVDFGEIGVKEDVCTVGV